jgi:hypothetical protein
MQSGGFGGGGFGGFGGFNDGGGFLGGFLPSPQKNGGNSPTSGFTRRPGETTARDLQGLMSVTIKMLLEESATGDTESTSVRFHGDHDASLVELVGQVESVSREHVFVKYIIDDGTSKIACKKYVDQDSPNSGVTVNVGKFVRVVGAFRRFGAEVSVTAHRVDEITKLDEIARHRIEVIHTFLLLTGRLAEASGAVSNASVNAYTTSSSGDVVPGKNLYPDFNNTGSTNWFHSELARVFGPRGPKHNRDLGVSRQQLYLHFVATMTGKQIDEKLDELRREGRVFTTIDENHFQPTS